MRTLKQTTIGLASLVVGLSLSVSFAMGQTTPEFEDVPPGHIAETAISWAAATGITAGVGNNQFGMGQTLTRYEMVTFLCRAFDPNACNAGTRGSDSFADVPAGHWADFSIGWAVDRGVTSGISATAFGGPIKLTREQMVTFLHRAKGSPTGGPAGSDAYQDVPVGPDHWANLPIGWAYQEGISAGVSHGFFGYGTTLSRQEMVLFLCRATAPVVCPPSHSPIQSGVTAAATTTVSAGGEDCEFPNHAARVSEAVYQVHAGGGIGTTFYIGNDEWLTAAHVVTNQQHVTLRRGSISLAADVLGSNAAADLALLRAPGSGIQPLGFAELSKIGPGHRVFSVGYPLYVAADPSVTSGVLSRIESDAALGTVLVTDAANSPGNSGGPLLNECGEVIGLVVRKIVGVAVEGISHAVATPTLTQRLPALRTVEPQDSSSSGDVRDWVHFTGESLHGEYEGYALGATEHSGYTWESSPIFALRCGVSNSTWNSIFVWTDWQIRGPDGDVIVEYQFENMEKPANEWWWSTTTTESTVFSSWPVHFASLLRNAATGSLWVTIWDHFSNDSYSMRFEIDGAVNVLDDLECW